MPKKKKINKAEVVRAYLQEHPDYMPTVVATAMKEQGIDVTPNRVSTIKCAMRKVRVRHRRRKSLVLIHAPKAVASNTLNEIKAAMLLLKLVGNVKSAKAMLDFAQQIRELV